MLVPEGFFDDLVQGAVNKNDMLQGLGGGRGELLVVQELDERLDVIAAEHRPEEKDRVFLRDDGRDRQAVRDFIKPLRLDLGRGIDAGRNAAPEKGQQEAGLPGRRALEEPADLGRLLGAERQGRNSEFFLSTSCLK